MSEGVVVALISLASSVLGAIFGYAGRTKKEAVKEATREQEQADLFKKVFDEMNEIKERLDKHNRYAEKFGSIEKSMVAMQKDIEYLRKEQK